MVEQNYIFKMARLVDLLEKGQASTAEDIAKKLNVSRRTVFRYLEEFRDRGAVIEFSKRESSYKLKNSFDFFETIIKGAL